MDLNTFTTALSGLDANAQGLSVVGNNLANLNTVGFKESSISFEDVLGQAFASGVGGSGEINLGGGVQASAITSNWASGSLQTTSNPLDVAIQGPGFLVMNNANGTYYTRDGDLKLDANNNLIGDNGMSVQGYMQNPATGQIDPNLGLQNIQLPAGLESPQITSQFQLAMNLDASAPSGTQFTKSIQVYDSVGTAHTATMTLQKSVSTATPPVTSWGFDVTIPETDVAGSSPTSTAQLSLITGAAAVNPPAAGTLIMDSSGNLSSAYVGTAPATPGALTDLQFPPTGVTLPAMADGGTLSPSLTWNLTNSTSTVSGFSSASAVSFSSQNGEAAGSLSNMTVGPDGTISATFTNGKTVSFAQVALAQFSNVDGLNPMGGNLYQETPASGDSSNRRAQFEAAAPWSEERSRHPTWIWQAN